MEMIVKILLINYNHTSIDIGFLKENDKYILPYLGYKKSVGHTLHLLYESLPPLSWHGIKLVNVLDGLNEKVYVIYKSQSFMERSILDTLNPIEWIKYEHLATTQTVYKPDAQIVKRSANL